VERFGFVGLPNAGKSSLLNAMTGAGVVAEDRLFATLDATTRRLDLPGGERVFLTDTVGFVRKLPHQLVQAFKSTLDVVVDAELLLHVVDASSGTVYEEIDAVQSVLREIGAGDIPQLMVFNKTDLADPVVVDRLIEDHPGSVATSAHSGEGVESLLLTIGDRLRATMSVLDLLIPFDRGDIMAAVHRSGQVLREQAVADGMRFRVRVDPRSAGRLQEFADTEDNPPTDAAAGDQRLTP